MPSQASSERSSQLILNSKYSVSPGMWEAAQPATCHQTSTRRTDLSAERLIPTWASAQADEAAPTGLAARGELCRIPLVSGMWGLPHLSRLPSSCSQDRQAVPGDNSPLSSACPRRTVSKSKLFTLG